MAYRYWETSMELEVRVAGPTVILRFDRFYKPNRR